MQIQSKHFYSKPVKLEAKKPGSDPSPAPELKPDSFVGRVQAGTYRGLKNSRTALMSAGAAGAVSSVVLSVARHTFEGPGLTAIAAMGMSPVFAIPVAAGIGAVMGLVTRDASEDTKTSAAIGVASGILTSCLLTGVIR